MLGRKTKIKWDKKLIGFGLRISEIISFRWEHIDFESGTVLLPTTKTGRRTHPLSEQTLSVLAAIPRIGDYVFCNVPHAPVSYAVVRSAFTKVVKAAGLVDVRLHDLRRTFMTRAAESGIGSHVLRDLLGHKTAAMADRYVRRANMPVGDATESISGELAAMMNGKGRKKKP